VNGRNSWPAGFIPSARLVTEQLELLQKQDYFAVLGVDRDVTPEDARHAFFKLTKKWHPSLYALEPEEVRNAVAEIFLLLKRAFDTMSDPDRSAAYRTRLPTLQPTKGPATMPRAMKPPPGIAAKASPTAAPAAAASGARGAPTAAAAPTAAPAHRAPLKTPSPIAPESRAESTRPASPAAHRPPTPSPAAVAVAAPRTATAAAPAPAPARAGPAPVPSAPRSPYTPPPSTRTSGGPVMMPARPAPLGSAPRPSGATPTRDAPAPAVAVAGARAPMAPPKVQASLNRTRISPSRPAATASAAGPPRPAPATKEPAAPAKAAEPPTEAHEIDLGINCLVAYDFKRARIHFDRVLETSAGHTRARALRIVADGLEAQVSGRTEQATKKYEEALAADPGCIEARTGLEEVARQRAAETQKKKGGLFRKFFYDE
jgi:DnaJ-like protein